MMNDELFPVGLESIFQKIYSRLSYLEKASIGSVTLAGSITAYDPETESKTVIGDLSQIGEDRVGVAQFVGDITPPPVPTTPIVEVSPGVMAVTWDGANENDEPMAPDFDHFNVYATSEGSTYLVGSIKNEAEVAVYAGAEGGTLWKFYLTSVDTNRNESGPSVLSEEFTAINAGADPLVYDAIEQLRTELAQAEASANAANQAAQAAQNAADAAMAQALAGNIPALVIDDVAPTSPTDKMIWVDTSVDPYVAKVWDASTSSWGAVTDSTLATLALAAAEAQKAADQASAVADVAMQVAGQAQDSANGKNNVYYVPTLPGGSNFVVGDTAFIRANVGDPITAQYQWDGTSWKSVTLNHQVISSVDLGKATVGELDGQYIKAQSLSAREVVIQNTDNIIPDPTFDFGNTTWNLAGWSVDSGVYQSVSRTGLTSYISPEPKVNGLRGVGITPNSWYTPQFDISVVRATTGIYKYKLAVEFLDKDRLGIYEVAIAENIEETTTTAISFKTLKYSPVKSPANSYYIVPKLYITDVLSSDIVYLQGISVFKAMEGNLVVDGSITADKLDINKLNAVDMYGGRIGTPSLTASGIKSGATYTHTKQEIFNTGSYLRRYQGSLGVSLTPSHPEYVKTVATDSNGSVNVIGAKNYTSNIPTEVQLYSKPIPVTPGKYVVVEYRGQYTQAVTDFNGMDTSAVIRPGYTDLTIQKSTSPYESLGSRSGKHATDGSITKSSALIPSNVNEIYVRLSLYPRTNSSADLPYSIYVPDEIILTEYDLETLPDGTTSAPYITTVEPDGIQIESLTGSSIDVKFNAREGSVPMFRVTDFAPMFPGYISPFTIGIYGGPALYMDTGTIASYNAYIKKPLNIESTVTNMNSDVTVSGTSTLNGPVRIPSTVDASETSTNHPFQIGPDNGVNMRLDNNEVIYLNNGAYSPVYNWASEYVYYNGQIKANAGLAVTGNATVSGVATVTGGMVVKSINYGYEAQSTVALTDTTNFAMYTSGDTIDVYRRGPWVTLKGVVKCTTANYINTTTGRIFAKLPTWAYPVGSKNENIICQGSGSDTWLLAIGASDGNLVAARYSGATQGTTVWLPFSVTYLAA